MKRLAFLSLLIPALIAPIQVQAQQYDRAGNCVRFPQQPNPEAELRYMSLTRVSVFVRDRILIRQDRRIF